MFVEVLVWDVRLLTEISYGYSNLNNSHIHQFFFLSHVKFLTNANFENERQEVPQSVSLEVGGFSSLLLSGR